MKNATNKNAEFTKKTYSFNKRKKLKIRDKKIDISKLGIGKHSKWDSLMHINILLDVEKLLISA